MSGKKEALLQASGGASRHNLLSPLFLPALSPSLSLSRVLPTLGMPFSPPPSPLHPPTAPPSPHRSRRRRARAASICASLSSSMATTRIPFMAFRKDASAAGGADRPPRREVGAPVSRSSGTQPRSSRLRMELMREMMDEERDDG